MRNSKSNSEVIGECMSRFSKSNDSWIQGSWLTGSEDAELEFIIEHERACLAGALALMQGLNPKANTIVDTRTLPCTTSIASAIEQLFPERYHGSEDVISHVVNFNDNSDTTIEDVLLVLKHAYEEELEKEEKLRQEEEANVEIVEWYVARKTVTND